MKDTLSAISIRVKYIFQTEGLLPLLRTGFPFLAGCFFRWENYYLYEEAMENLKNMNEADLVPKIDNLTLKVVSTNEQADELAANGFDLRSHSIYAKRRLDKRAIAFCILIGRELANVGWVAMTEEAKNTIVSFPYRVDFLNKEAWTGGDVTVPKYRRKGLLAYTYYKKLQSLKERGIVTARCAVDTSNIAPQRMLAKFGAKIYAKARYLKILWWQFWKETPLTQAE